MKQLMRYQILSGRAIEVQEALIDPDRRGAKRGKKLSQSTEAKTTRNRKAAERTLARLLNCNFCAGDLWLTLTLPPERLPETREELPRIVRNFIGRIGRAYCRETGRKLRYIWVLAERDSKTGKDVRPHYHLVMDRVAWELVCAHWPKEDVTYRLLDGRGDYTGVARYMLGNVRPEPGKKTWHPSRGLKQPIFTAPVPARRAGAVRVPKNAEIRERETRTDAENGFSAFYLRYVVPEGPAAERRPRAKGGGA